MLLENNTLTLDFPKKETAKAPSSINAYHALQDINEVEPLTDEDQETLQMVREVLRKRNAIDKFGVSLLHDHFDINEDEMLVETTDPVTRTQTIKPYRNKELKEANILEDGYIQTNWRFDKNDPKNLICLLACSGGNGSHAPAHRVQI